MALRLSVELGIAHFSKKRLYRLSNSSRLSSTRLSRMSSYVGVRLCRKRRSRMVSRMASLVVVLIAQARNGSENRSRFRVPSGSSVSNRLAVPLARGIASGLLAVRLRRDTMQSLIRTSLSFMCISSRKCASWANSSQRRQKYSPVVGFRSPWMKYLWCCNRMESLPFAMPNVELTGRRRQDAKPGPQTMYRVPAARAWWPAVGAPVERRVRRHFRRPRRFNSQSCNRCCTACRLDRHVVSGLAASRRRILRMRPCLSLSQDTEHRSFQ